MSRMIRFEWKRIWQSRLTRFAVIGCGLFLVFCVWSGIRQTTAVDRNGNSFSGMRAVRTLQETQNRQKLDQKTVNEILEQYISYTENPETSSDDPELAYLSPEIYRTWYQPEADLFRLIAGVYRGQDDAQDSIGDILRQSLDKDFYQARTERLQEDLSVLYPDTITASEADWWNEKDQKVGEYTYGYAQGWQKILTTGSWIILVMIIVCVGTAPVFAGEYQTRCDSLLLTMRYGKNRLIRAKLAASFLYMTIIYWGITLLYSLAFLILCGTGGWDLPVQINYPGVSVSYDLNMLQSCAIFLVLGYLFTIGMTGMTLFLSSVFKNAYSVIIIAFLFLIIPTFLSLENGGYAWKHILALIPAKIADFNFTSYLVFSAGNMKIPWPFAAMAVNGVIFLLCAAAGYFVFQKHQVNR